MKVMYKSSAFSLKHRLEAQIKAFQGIVDACNQALKCVHPKDLEVRNNHIRERDLATRVIKQLMDQLDENKKDILGGLD